MEEILKLIATGGGIGVSATWAFWLWRLEPRLKAIEIALNMQSKVELLRLAASPYVASELKESARRFLEEIPKA